MFQHLHTNRLNNTLLCSLVTLITMLYTTQPIFANGTNINQLTHMDLSQLQQLEITSVDKRATKLDDTAASVFVLTRQDILRSGITTIPELMRMVPGMEVGRIDASTWAIGTRGFTDKFSNKLLVMVDGRSVYTPLFSGVEWERLNPLLQNIERIEIIRGPGSSIWGSNAINGVINIITSNAEDTQGVLIHGGGGNKVQNQAGLRYGDTIGSTSFRISGNTDNHDSQPAFATRNSNQDNWQRNRGDFRLDSPLSANDTLSIQGADYGGTLYNKGSTITGSHLMATWLHRLRSDAGFRLQGYVDQTKSNRRTSINIDKITTYDIDFSHHFSPMPHHTLNWGINYRRVQFNNAIGSPLFYTPAKLRTSLYQGFFQEQWHIGNWLLTAGSKFERNSFTGFEYQPSLRLLWHASPRHIVWGAISRTVAVPTRADTGFGFDFGSIALQPNVNLQSEQAIVSELGYRAHPLPSLDINISGFINRYRKLATTEQAGKTFTLGNLMQGTTHGVIASVDWRPSEPWRLVAGYSYLSLQGLHLLPTSTDTNSDSFFQGTSPKQQFSLRSQLDLPWKIQFDSSLYYVGTLTHDGQTTFPDPIPAYTRVDLRIGWKPMRSLALSFAVNDAFDRQRPQFTYRRTHAEIGRSLHAELTWWQE